jgi:hypothetical protein
MSPKNALEAAGGADETEYEANHYGFTVVANPSIAYAIRAIQFVTGVRYGMSNILQISANNATINESSTTFTVGA